MDVGWGSENGCWFPGPPENGCWFPGPAEQWIAKWMWDLRWPCNMDAKWLLGFTPNRKMGVEWQRLGKVLWKGGLQMICFGCWAVESVERNPPTIRPTRSTDALATAPNPGSYSSSLPDMLT